MEPAALSAAVAASATQAGYGVAKLGYVADGMHRIGPTCSLPSYEYSFGCAPGHYLTNLTVDAFDSNPMDVELYIMGGAACR